MRARATVLALTFATAALGAARAEDRPHAMPSAIEGCEEFVGVNEGERRMCARCKPGYHLSSTKTCLRLGDFGSTRDAIHPRIRRPLITLP